MMIEQLCRLGENLNCKILRDVQLKDYTTFKVGGKCPALIEISSEESLSELMKFAKENNVRTMIIGKGSNMLFDDMGYDGIIFLMNSSFSQITLLDETTIEVEAGCSLIRLCKFALEHSLSGLEFAYGIPGTVGGAIYMNAGAYGGEIKNVIQSARAVDDCGNVNIYDKEKLNLSYRHSFFHDANSIVTKGIFKLHKGNKAEIEAKMRDLMASRKDKQPLDFPNAGSTFKRPEGQFAGKLIQDCDLKGFSIGGAQVSEKHSGFVINKGNATSEDIKGLINYVQNEVKQQTGYNLKCEVRIIPYKE